MQEGHGVYDCCKKCGRYVRYDGVADETGTYHRKCKEGPEIMVRSTAVNADDIDESIVDGLIDEMGKMPTAYFNVLVIATVVVTPLPELGEKVYDANEERRNEDNYENH